MFPFLAAPAAETTGIALKDISEEPELVEESVLHRTLDVGLFAKLVMTVDDDEGVVGGDSGPLDGTEGREQLGDTGAAAPFLGTAFLPKNF